MLNKKEFRATASLVGTIIGAGIFGVPYVISKVGISAGLIYFLILGTVTILMHLYFAEIVLAVREKHRFPGFAKHFLGEWGKIVAVVLGIFGGWLSLTAYIILGGLFLSIIFDRWFGIGAFYWSLIFTSFGMMIVMGGLRRFARTETILSIALVFLILLISLLGIPKIQLVNLLNFEQNNLFLPYGVILFSLSGLAVIPELEDMIGDGRRKELRRSIFLGTFIPIIITAIFGIVIAGVTGVFTSDDAVSGLVGVFGEWIILIGAITGFLAIITSFVAFLINQINTFIYDYKMNKYLSWVLSIGVSLVFFVAGMQNFIGVIGLSGGVMGGLTGVLLVIMYLVLQKKKKKSGLYWIIPSAVAVFFVLGAAAEISVFVQK